MDCKNIENKQNKIKDRVHIVENLEIATEISEARNKSQTIESNKDITWNKFTSEAFCISAQTSYFCFLPPSNIIPAHAETSLDSEQLIPDVSKNPEEREENCFDSIVIRTLLAANLTLCSFFYQKLVQFLPLRRKTL